MEAWWERARYEDRRMQSFMGSSFKVTNPATPSSRCPTGTSSPPRRTKGRAARKYHRCSLPRCIPRPRCRRGTKPRSYAGTVRFADSGPISLLTVSSPCEMPTVEPVPCHVATDHFRGGLAQLAVGPLGCCEAATRERTRAMTTEPSPEGPGPVPSRPDPVPHDPRPPAEPGPSEPGPQPDAEPPPAPGPGSRPAAEPPD